MLYRAMIAQSARKMDPLFSKRRACSRLAFVLLGAMGLSTVGLCQPAPVNMAWIPAGEFQMGDSFHEGADFESPLHKVYVSAFSIDRFEVTKALWDEVYLWATNNNYEFSSRGLGKGPNHPVHNINWYDAVKWCNARSEKEGRIPAYYTNAAQTSVYRAGRIDVQNSHVKWTASYRLPTEAEWEKAARGGLSDKRFPWGDTISHSQAN